MSKHRYFPMTIQLIDGGSIRVIQKPEDLPQGRRFKVIQIQKQKDDV